MDASLGTEREQLQHEAALVVKGSWGTKVEAVVRRVMYLLDPDRPGGHRDAKCLVFSEWEDALRVVAAALKANDVPAAPTLGRGRKLRDAIDAFKGVAPPPTGEPSPKALLMPLRRGANGLNLTEAQHVILLEPVRASADIFGSCCNDRMSAFSAIGPTASRRRGFRTPSLKSIFRSSRSQL